MATDISKQVISITEEYLGPAAERFIDKLSTFHLHKSSDKLTTKDLPKLAEWIKVSMGLLTDDRSIVDDYVKKVLGLAS